MALVAWSLIHAVIASAEGDPALHGFFDVEIRVALETAAVKADVDGDGGNLTITSGQTGAGLDVASTGKILAEWAPQGIKINHLTYPTNGARIESKSGIINFNGKKYRGYLLLWNGQNGTLTVVNHLPLDDYIRSVVAMEIPKTWPLEALKAQAVAARTYALNKRQENAGNLFDVTPDVMDQVYGGIGVENEAANQAVKATEGLTLVYENHLALTYFHSNAGGRTENGSEVFHTANAPYLKSVACRYSGDSPYYSWQLSVSLPEIESALARDGLFSGKISRISVQSHTDSGRVKQLKIYGVNKTELLDASAFRRALGGTKLKSTKFSVRSYGRTVTFVGNGYGHGVGLCQWGAKGMAEHKIGFKEILSHFYPGAVLSTSFLTSAME